jgi:RHS repeat-associated protein
MQKVAHHWPDLPSSQNHCLITQSCLRADPTKMRARARPVRREAYFCLDLLSAFGLQAPAGGEVGTPSAAIQSYGNFIGGGGNTGNSSWPKGWLNILVFDKNYTLVDVAYEQLSSTYVQPVGNPTKQPHGLLSKTVTIKEPGYVYIYVSNEGTVQQEIYFDDLTLTHTKGAIVQMDDYYPFGLTYNSYSRENSMTNDYQYNGKEMQDELNLGWLDYGARMYMSDLGRWGVVDPLSEVSIAESAYCYVGNNPVYFHDPTGMFGLASTFVDPNGIESEI